MLEPSRNDKAPCLPSWFDIPFGKRFIAANNARVEELLWF
jgi:hypothetical protein